MFNRLPCSLLIYMILQAGCLRRELFKLALRQLYMPMVTSCSVIGNFRLEDIKEILLLEAATQSFRR